MVMGTRIAAVETFVLKLSAAEPYLGEAGSPTAGYQVRAPWRSLYSRRYETLLVKITAEDGAIGWGEALAPVGPEVVGAVIDRLLGPYLLGQAGHPRVLTTALYELMRERGHLGGHQGDAVAALDIALWDLRARQLGIGVHELLGGAYRERIPVYVSGLPAPDDAGRAALAADWVARGARSVKLHLGNGVEADLATVDAVQTAAPELRVAVDAHWAYDVNSARRLAVELAAREVAFLEAPLPPEDLVGHAELTTTAPLPIAIGEAWRHRHEASPWISGRAARIVQPDVARTGLTEGLAIAELAAAAHLQVAPHHSVALAPAIAAGIHLAAVCSQLALLEYQPGTATVASQITTDSMTPIDGAYYELPKGPGLGIEVNEAEVRRLADEERNLR